MVGGGSSLIGAHLRVCGGATTYVNLLGRSMKSSTFTKSRANMLFLFAFALAAFAFSLASASITCLKVGAIATAQWTNAAAQMCTWTGTVGSNFGIDTANNGK